MIRPYSLLLCCAAFILTCLPASLLGQAYDRPAAIVGNKIILESELQSQMQLQALQNRVDISRPQQRAQLRTEILAQMIDDRLILAEAEKDTMISIDQAEIEQALTEHIASIRGQFGTEEAFERQMEEEGLTMGELRRRFRNDTANQLLKQKLISMKLGNVSVTNGEVRDFHDRYADSIPPVPASAKLAHILLTIDIDTSRILATRDRLTGLKLQIDQGTDFADIAREHSEDPTADFGGELGWFGPGDLVPEFENAVKRLNPGQLSGVVRTQFGWHLIEVEEKDGARFRTRHILLKLQPEQSDTLATVQRADSLLAEIHNGADFCLLVRDNTADIESQKNCGELGWYPLDQMYPEFREALAGRTVGDYAGPAISEFGVHILRILDQQESREYTLEDDWDAIKQLARREKTNRIVSGWIAEIRDETFVEIKDYQ